jgi:hypothetical protein
LVLQHTQNQSRIRLGRIPYIPPAKHFSFDTIALGGGQYNGNVFQILLKNNGDLIYAGQWKTAKDGIFRGKVPQNIVRWIKDKYLALPLDTMRTWYSTNRLHSEARSVVFTRNGRIQKTIHSVGNSAFMRFEWANQILSQIPFSIHLDTLIDTKTQYLSLPLLHIIKNSSQKTLDPLNNTNMVVWNAIFEGKESSFHNFEERYTIITTPSLYSDHHDYISTDGRYYKLTDSEGKTRIIDAGYNFIQSNFPDSLFTFTPLIPTRPSK